MHVLSVVLTAKYEKVSSTQSCSFPCKRTAVINSLLAVSRGFGSAHFWLKVVLGPRDKLHLKVEVEMRGYHLEICQLVNLWDDLINHSIT